jgi:hypothetical protein
MAFGNMFMGYDGMNAPPQADSFMTPPAQPPAQPPAPQMPAAFTQNRMAQMGAPAVAQIGEALFDKYRQNKWNKQHGTEVDEMGADSSPKTTENKPPMIGGGTGYQQPADGRQASMRKGSGIFDGRMGSELMKAFMPF